MPSVSCTPRAQRVARDFEVKVFGLGGWKMVGIRTYDTEEKRARDASMREREWELAARAPDGSRDGTVEHQTCLLVVCLKA